MRRRRCGAAILELAQESPVSLSYHLLRCCAAAATNRRPARHLPHPPDREIDMQRRHAARRQFMKRACALTMAGLPAGAMAQTAATVAVRQDWTSFCSSPDYASLIDGIGRMRANADAADPRSWGYWSLAQERHAPLGMPYFLAWHRG